MRCIPKHIILLLTIPSRITPLQRPLECICSLNTLQLLTPKIPLKVSTFASRLKNRVHGPERSNIYWKYGLLPSAAPFPVKIPLVYQVIGQYLDFLTIVFGIDSIWHITILFDVHIGFIVNGGMSMQSSWPIGLLWRVYCVFSILR